MFNLNIYMPASVIIFTPVTITTFAEVSTITLTSPSASCMATLPLSTDTSVFIGVAKPRQLPGHHPSISKLLIRIN